VIGGVLGETLVLGDIEAEGDTLRLAEADGEVEVEGETEDEGDTLRLTEAEGLSDDEGDTLRLTEAEGLTELTAAGLKEICWHLQFVEPLREADWVILPAGVFTASVSPIENWLPPWRLTQFVLFDAVTESWMTGIITQQLSETVDKEEEAVLPLDDADSVELSGCPVCWTPVKETAAAPTTLVVGTDIETSWLPVSGPIR